jgi:uncharacterized protein DUF6790
MFQLFFIVLAVLGATIHLAFSRKRRSSPLAIAETYLLYLFVFYVGVMGVVTAVFHVFFQARASASIGWAPSPFEYEVGIADLTVGVLGILCVWFRENFWLATATANAVWLLGDAVGHVRQMIEQNNHAQNNAGIFLVLEFLMPPLILVLTLYSRHSRHAAS